MHSSADPLYLEQSVEVILARIIGDGQPIAGVGVQIADVAVVVLAVGDEVVGGVVHILCAAIDLLPQRDLELLHALRRAAAVDGEQPVRRGEIVGLAAPDAVEDDVQRAVGHSRGVFGGGVGDALDHQRVAAGGRPLGGVLLLYLVRRAGQLVGDGRQCAFAAGEHQRSQKQRQRKDKDPFCFLHGFLSSKIAEKCTFARHDTGIVYRIFFLHTRHFSAFPHSVPSGPRIRRRQGRSGPGQRANRTGRAPSPARPGCADRPSAGPARNRWPTGSCCRR